MSNQPLISIIVPVYNAQQYLSDCISSLIKQSYDNLEIIAVNDGSSDTSLEILRDFQAKDNRIKVIDQKNAGVSAARNNGIKHASGEYVMFVDADDWIDAETCQTAISKLTNTDADVVMWSYTSEFEHRSEQKKLFPQERIFESDDVAYHLHRRFVGIIGEELAHPEFADSLCPVWGKLYKRSLLDGISFTDLKKIGTYEDGLYNLFVFERVQRAVYLPEYFYHYRRTTTESVTSGYREKLFDQWQNLFQIMNSYIQEHKLDSQYNTALQNRIALSLLGLGLNEMSSDKSFIGKCKEIKRIISLPEYREAYCQLDYQYFPIHWKVFYKCAKYRCSVAIVFLLKVIQHIISR
ncbi:MAG: glycosyltransferase [Ruminococcus sp.]|nr:glycosyltransferase [Ruminococcus sp.]